MRVWAAVAAGGAGRRMGAGEPKQFLRLGNVPILARAVSGLDGWGRVEGFSVAVPGPHRERARGILEGAGVGARLAVVEGGAERQESVLRALEALPGLGASDGDVVLVHDGSRPFPPVHRLDELVAASTPDGALLAVPLADTLKKERGGAVAGTIDRAGLWRAQTPQAFPLAVLREALASAVEQGARVTDEAQAVERTGRSPRLIAGDPRNIKVTYPEDLDLAEALLAAREGSPGAPRPAVGHGYDVHRLVDGRPLVLGGVEIPFEQGLLGHSDADVVAHAVADAVLGAAGLGDLGRHFPPSDPRWKGVSSLIILKEVSRMVAGEGLRVERVDATLVAQRPRVAPHVPAMEEALARALGVPPGAVTVKATTTEGLGFEGRGEGMSAHAVALVARER